DDFQPKPFPHKKRKNQPLIFLHVNSFQYLLSMPYSQSAHRLLIAGTASKDKYTDLIDRYL
ncbi:hypothetical protein ACNHGO_004832, partial [Salmonella enterica subsp. enterica serovar Newport]